MYYFDKIQRPEIFQGVNKKKKYFEGWYYKFVHPTKNISIAFIPGISLTKNDAHAFIQVIYYNEETSKSLITKYIRFHKDDFTYTLSPFSITIGNNLFTLEYIDISLQDDSIDFNGKIDLIQINRIQSSFLNPNIMGPFAYLQIMECYHGVISMSHQLFGKINIAGDTIDFSRGVGYLEKDWGKSFPSEYVWMQSNHFSNKSTSFMFSHATIPFLFLKFRGLIVNLIIDNHEYRFATYNFAKILKRVIDNQNAVYVIKRRKLRLEIHAYTDTSTKLIAPINGEMNHTIKEGLSGKIAINLYHDNRIIYEDTGYNAGIEIVEKLEKK